MKMKKIEKALISTLTQQMLINDVLYPLLDVVYIFKVTDSYNKLPNERLPFGDIHEYLSRCFYRIYGSLDKILYLDPDTYSRVRSIIQDVQEFVCKYSGVDGLDAKYFKLNPNLKYFSAAFGVRNESEDAYYGFEELGCLRNKISNKDLQDGKEYFARKQQESDERNLHYDEDDFLMLEVAYAVRLAFMEALFN